MRVAIVLSRFNLSITADLLAGALSQLKLLSINADDIKVVGVAGAFEIPATLAVLADSKNFSALIALGCVIRGDTPHFDYVCAETARGCMQVSLDYKIPVGFGVITAATQEQALQRSDPNTSTGSEEVKDGQATTSNKGIEAVSAAIELAQTFEQLRSKDRKN